jgi:hypothetical protein
MKKILFFVFIFTNLISKGQVTLDITGKKIKITTSNYTWELGSYEYYSANDNEERITVRGAGNTSDFYKSAITSFNLNAVAQPLTWSAIKSAIIANVSATGAAGVSGGGGDASAANQVTGNNSLVSIDNKLTSSATNAAQIATNTKLDLLHTDLIAATPTGTNNIGTIDLRGQVFNLTTAITTLRSSIPGSITTGGKFISCANTGIANATFNGTLIKPNETITLPFLPNSTYGVIAYDGTGTDLLIVKLN